ncbi:MAG TPA: OmpA family protein, partial [Leptospiraceae bacterium]|nr:OmpA family protein [Leptospiraceae bacterium]
MSYYKTIKGKKYDKELLDMAEEFVSGKGDGRISLAEAKKLIEAVKDGNEYTDVEKRTVEYIRNNYTFTESADKWFRTE